MSNLIKALLIPITFSINRTPRQHHLELWFSDKPEKKSKDSAPPSLASWKKADQLYRKSTVNGDHQFLIPSTVELINHFEGVQSNYPSAFQQIGNNPTTATALNKLQLIPCSQHNLNLFQRSLQSQPFYIEVGKRTFNLFVFHQEVYWKIPCHPRASMNLMEFQQPVITIETLDNASFFTYLHEIPWADIATQLGTVAEPLQNHIPVHASPIYGCGNQSY